MKRIAYLIFMLSLIFSTGNAQEITGKWYSLDSDTGKNESIIELYENEGKIYGRIAALLKAEDQGKLCSECKGKDQNIPLEGLTIVNGLTKDGDEWNDGKILDPKNGKWYDCELSFDDENKLKIRGFIGFSLLGRTEYWLRVLE